MTAIELLPIHDLQACATRTSRAPVTVTEAEGLALAIKALADPTRLRIISMVAAHDNREACVCDLTEPLGLSQPTVSHHLKILVTAGYLSRSKRGTWAYYQLVPGTIDTIAKQLAKL